MEDCAGREWLPFFFYLNCKRNLTIMAATGLFGPHPLTPQGIDAAVNGVAPGTYVLGRTEGETFYVDYVGRSDGDLNDRLKDWTDSKYDYFKFGFFKTAKAAFEKECTVFHDFGGTGKLDNDIHPDRPDGSDWRCPRCNVFS